MNFKTLPLSNYHPIAYFSLEYGINDDLPIYSGGLGILAGDILKQACDSQLPMVGIGLFYRHGYFRQEISSSGDQVEKYIESKPEKILQPVKNRDGQDMLIALTVEERTIFAGVWEYLLGKNPLYLLDTNVEQNSPQDRLITDRLYGGGPNTRILQEIVLGIGGEKALFELGIHPVIYHLNEGHSAFSIFEIVHHAMKKSVLSFEEAFKKVQRQIVFTNHTLVPAGNDIFPKTRVRNILKNYADHLAIPIDKMINKGAVPNQPDDFNMTTLALKMSCRTNAVSKLHSKFARNIWPSVNMPPITNGVHLPSWVYPQLKNYCPNFSTKELNKLDNITLWEIHKKAKNKLIDFVNTTCRTNFNNYAATLIWARRFASYKQPTILFSEVDALKKLSQSAHGALQIIIAGKAHPHDSEGKKYIKYINNLILRENLSSWIVFLPDYSINSAKYLVQGADIWLNTPLRGLEASGTSGMKSAANGVLQCSTNDGWIYETPLNKIGWELHNTHTARSLYEIMEKEILPKYYTRNRDGYSPVWMEMMREAIDIIWKRYSTRRLLSEYIDILYKPALEGKENGLIYDQE